MNLTVTKSLLVMVLFSTLVLGCSSKSFDDDSSKPSWASGLSDEQYYILVDKGTEAPFTGSLLNNKLNGTYYTAGCDLPVFSSVTKYDSGTGWPSFYDVIAENVDLVPDYKLGYKRMEVVSKCGEHLGHVFDDGPQPTGKRYCINSDALVFVES